MSSNYIHNVTNSGYRLNAYQDKHSWLLSFHACLSAHCILVINYRRKHSNMLFSCMWGSELLFYWWFGIPIFGSPLDFLSIWFLLCDLYLDTESL